MLGTCGLPGNLLWPASFEHHKLPLPPRGSLSCLLQVLIDLLLSYLIYPGSDPLLGYSFPFEVLWAAGFGLTADYIPKFGLYTVLMDSNRLTFSLCQSLFPRIHSRLILHFPPNLFYQHLRHYLQLNNSASVNPGRLWISPSPTAQKAHQYGIRVQTLITAHVIQITNTVNILFLYMILKPPAHSTNQMTLIMWQKIAPLCYNFHSALIKNCWLIILPRFQICFFSEGTWNVIIYLKMFPWILLTGICLQDIHGDLCSVPALAFWMILTLA